MGKRTWSNSTFNLYNSPIDLYPSINTKNILSYQHPLNEPVSISTALWIQTIDGYSRGDILSASYTEFINLASINH